VIVIGQTQPGTSVSQPVLPSDSACFDEAILRPISLGSRLRSDEAGRNAQAQTGHGPTCQFDERRAANCCYAHARRHPYGVEQCRRQHEKRSAEPMMLGPAETYSERMSH
jgi:hypothetical protein